MYITFSTINYIRWTENNDWVIASILIGLFAYVFMLLSLNRESSLKDFILHPISEGANLLANWVIISMVFVLVMAVLLSQYIPVVPKTISQYHLFGWELNKWGFTLLAITLFYVSKSLVSYLFYMSINEGDRWTRLVFVSTKFYFILSLIIMIINIVHYYFGIDYGIVLRYYWFFAVFVFVFKLFFYGFNKNSILPEDWYYKILYICTLQIIPIGVLWRLLFL